MSHDDTNGDDIPSVVSREMFVETMVGCINDETRADDASPCAPLELQTDWTTDLP